MKRITSFMMMLLLVVSILVTGCSSETGSPEETVIRLGLAPDEDSAEILRAYAPFIEYLEKKTGYTIEASVGADYPAVVEAINAGHLDLAWFGPSEYMLATEVVDVGVEAFASAIQSKDSVPYRSIFVVHKDSDIQSLEDIKGKSIAFTDPASTSGHIFGRYTLVNEGIDPDTDLGEVIYSGSHDANVLSVEKKQVDVGVMSSRKLPRFVEKGIVDGDNIRIIAESVLIPPDPISFKCDLPEDIKENVVKAFTEKSDELSKALEGTGFESFDPVNDQDYDLIRDAYEIAGLKPEL
ncbi:phosphate/phosphite/phosphonate ABC transporter substrate-binding protein [Chengkuizengella axinellae]|uniref:Phosphate/phosphite/phosphonate ABC transporter substrate-binding protein n=1 Tax=Chengkuizengella axinellae TaxID=3064388 RepID=A0ABT9IYP1_9BACL|nr:phosphate/phosphite/phosphonate ABC transporter substrate-binding protein [Chengkuizengella sp. 2205SS18-9]MDP5274428.1 phosphate/phosphite/phosphonate ABC transporter substrate-binding protein [Chengkuizengella sp. 2205SS18-9]